MSMQQEACAPFGAPPRSIVPSIDRSVSPPRPRLVADLVSRAIDIALADTLTCREDACSLVNRRYAWRGYGDHHTLPSHSASATFTAADDGVVLGTVTLVADSEMGLAADTLFADELNGFRTTPGRKICELSRLAFDVGLPSKPLLAALFHIVFIYGYHRHRCTDLFIEVNPRHRRFYEAMLGFTPVGTPRQHASVGAPSQLMWLEISSIRRRIDAATLDRSDTAPRSLYALFFSRDDALELADDLTSEAAADRAQDATARVKVFIPEL